MWPLTDTHSSNSLGDTSQPVSKSFLGITLSHTFSTPPYTLTLILPQFENDFFYKTLQAPCLNAPRIRVCYYSGDLIFLITSSGTIMISWSFTPQESSIPSFCHPLRLLPLKIKGRMPYDMYFLFLIQFCCSLRRKRVSVLIFKCISFAHRFQSSAESVKFMILLPGSLGQHVVAETTLTIRENGHKFSKKLLLN